MAKVSIYLNFPGNAEEAFNFYKTVFKTAFDGPIVRMDDMPASPGMPDLSDAEKKMVMHASLPVLGGTRIMATDMLESMGFSTGVDIAALLELRRDVESWLGDERYSGAIARAGLPKTFEIAK